MRERTFPEIFKCYTNTFIIITEEEVQEEEKNFAIELMSIALGLEKSKYNNITLR